MRELLDIRIGTMIRANAPDPVRQRTISETLFWWRATIRTPPEAMKT